MKTMQNSWMTLAAMVMLCGFILTLPGCSGNKTDGGDQQEEAAAKEDRSGPEYTSMYICPMHCKGSGSDEPGECPICGMAYKENADYQPQGADETSAAGQEDHDHDDHEGHDHGEHEGHDH